jgi:biopolymer transport protein ExbB/TolQ
MAQISNSETENKLSWVRQDVEQRLLFRGGRHTRVNNMLSALVGLLLTVVFYASLIPFDDSRLAKMFTRRGFVPYVITFFTAWCLAILFFKWRKLVFQRQSLGIAVVPAEHDFVLSPATVNIVLDRTREHVDDPRHFVLFNRMTIALSNLKNLGRVADVDDILRSQAEVDESSMETSYSLLAGFIWAIPVLGFIGTVIGLSDAIGGFGDVLKTAADMESIKAALQNVTGGLATAFETTLEALVASLIIQLMVTFLKKAEQEFLDECSDYCSRNIVNKLRLMPFQPDSSE